MAIFPVPSILTQLVSTLCRCSLVGLSVSMAYLGSSAALALPVPESETTVTQHITETRPQSPLENGIYLYGQAAQPHQLGVTYLVFQVIDQQAIGAFYMPSSSFDCFSGELQSDRLALTIVNSYDQTTYPYTIAVQADNSLVASEQGNGASVSLPGYHSITTLSDLDHHLIATCRSTLLPEADTPI